VQRVTPGGEPGSRRGRWCLDSQARPPYYQRGSCLGGNHLTGHRRATHRLDHLLFSARAPRGPRSHSPRTGCRLPARGSATFCRRR